MQEFKNWFLKQNDYIDDSIVNDNSIPKIFRKISFKDNKFVVFKKSQTIHNPKDLVVTRNGKRNTKLKNRSKKLAKICWKDLFKQHFEKR